jgi:hypothetical protein
MPRVQLDMVLESVVYRRVEMSFHHRRGIYRWMDDKIWIFKIFCSSNGQNDYFFNF